ncbi:MAG: response regulator [Luteimonas sp.]
MKSRTPRILLVEDDAVSRAFLAQALEVLPARVDATASAGQARACADAGIDHDLWLIDAHLPDGGGPALLAALRARTSWTPAIAHTAGADPATAASLRAAGFVEVLRKPITCVALRSVVRCVLGHPVAVADAINQQPVWDDAMAMAALHTDHGQVQALRWLFLDELAAQRHAIVQALTSGDRAAAVPVLHRLRASCGFVGAVRLEAAVSSLQREPASSDALQTFVAAAEALLG